MELSSARLGSHANFDENHPQILQHGEGNQSAGALFR